MSDSPAPDTKKFRHVREIIEEKGLKRDSEEVERQRMLDTLDDFCGTAISMNNEPLSGTPGSGVPREPTTAWLVERVLSENQQTPIWWCGTGGDVAPEWTADANKARKFVSREAAESFITRYVGFRTGAATEHVFLGAVPSVERGANSQSAPSSSDSRTFERGSGEAPTEPGIIETLLDYPTAARVVHLWLGEFCDETRPFPNMIAHAARQAADELTRLRSAHASLTAEGERWQDALHRQISEEQAECERLRSAFGIVPDGRSLEAQLTDIAAAHASLEREVVGLRADKARLDWLNDEHQRFDPVMRLVVKMHYRRIGSDWGNIDALDIREDVPVCAR